MQPLLVQHVEQVYIIAALCGHNNEFGNFSLNFRNNMPKNVMLGKRNCFFFGVYWVGIYHDCLLLLTILDKLSEITY